MKNELDKKGIESFEYLKDEDKEMMKSFMRSTKGCLITRYKHVRGTESTTLLYFTKDMITERIDNCSKMLRGTTNLVVAQLAKGTPLSKIWLTLGSVDLVFIRGSYADLSVYRSIVDMMVKLNVDDFLILRTDEWMITGTGSIMLLKELERKGFDTTILPLASEMFKTLEGFEAIQAQKILAAGKALISVHWEVNEKNRDVQQLKCYIIKTKSSKQKQRLKEAKD